MDRQVALPKTVVNQCIVWFILIPQSILLLLNIRSWALISGEAGSTEINSALLLLGCEIVILVGAVLAYWLCRRGVPVISKLSALITLAAHAGYMVLFVSSVDLIPNTIQPWILSAGNVGRWNITLLMPGAFISLYAFAKLIFANSRGLKAIFGTLGLTFGVPLAWYLFTTLLQPTWFGQSAWIGMIIITSVSIMLFLAAIINIFDNLLEIEPATHLSIKHYFIALLLGLAAPIGGLILNNSIAFPLDLQATSLYLLTILNGLILLLKPGKTYLLKTKYFFRCVTFPFIAYFFLVFLPFLPLSLIAVMAVGAGFLMLTPLALGIFQFRIIHSEYHLLISEQGKLKTIAITVVGLLILPSYFMADAVVDKIVLDKTLNYFYAHDVNADPLTEAEINRSAKALIQLRDRKSDIQMPYIAGFYNAVVFGDMVLPDSKIVQTYRWLTKQALPKNNSDFHIPIFHNRGFRRNLVKPQSAVALEKIEQLPSTIPNKQTIRLTLKNLTANTHTQYRESLHLPEGVFVTGLRLKIGKQWVDGRVFDKKTALWVFQKITEFRHDPAIIYYTTPSTIELRVYPFPVEGTREVEIELEYHQNIDARIRIGEAIVDLNPEHNTPSLISQDGTLTIDANERGFTRTPYLHFILDFSEGAEFSTQSYLDKIKTIGAKFGIEQVTVTAANIASTKTAPTELINIQNEDSLANHLNALVLPVQGGLWLEQAITNETLRISAQLNNNNFTQVPTFVIIKGDNTRQEENIDMHQWNRLIPDLGPLYFYQHNILSHRSLNINERINGVSKYKPASVVAIKDSSQIQLYAANTSSILNITNVKNLSAYNAHTQNFEPIHNISSSYPTDTNWSKLATLWSDWHTAKLHPAQFESERQTFMASSRQYSLLLPSTAFIVVESDSQWKILERKEGQSLRNHSALEFENEQQASEPIWWILLALFLLFIYIKDRLSAREKAKYLVDNE